jgi:hypothetical protein
MINAKRSTLSSKTIQEPMLAKKLNAGSSRGDQRRLSISLQ